MLRNVATALIIVFGVFVMAFIFAFALDYFDLRSRECCEASVSQGIQACPFVLESVTVTPTGTLTETPVVTATPLLLLTATRTLESSPAPGPSSTPQPNPTNVPPEPTNEVKCNRGLGNGSEGCDPGSSGGNPGKAGEGDG